MKNNILVNDKLIIEISKLKSEISELKVLIKYYEQQFRLAKHRKFGASSEKSEYDQLSLFNEAEITSDVNVPEPELTEVEHHFRKRKRLPNDRLPENLPVEVVEYDLPDDEQICSKCGNSLHVMGRETRKELVIIPAQVKIREHVQKVYSCRDCEKNACSVPVEKVPVSSPVLKGSFASPEAIAHIMCQKFVMAVPLYRQEQDWNRQGVILSRQTMSNWLINATKNWLEPIYNALREQLLSHTVLHADETTLQVLKEPNKTTQSKSYMWLYRTSGEAKHQIVLYEYQPSRRAECPATFLKNFKGYLHTDGYERYHELPENIVIVGCWAHMRRKFDEALKALPEKDREGSNALVGKRYCDALFELERKFENLTPEEKFSKRQKLSKPIIEEFFNWVTSLRTLPKMPIGKAQYYALSQRKYLESYLFRWAARN
jgi:transposase